ncbi:aldehyde dehydrogenase family protein [Geodermatophilus sp. SYSU D00867]
MSVPGSLFIDGTWQDARSGRVLRVLDPFDGSLVAAHDAAAPGDVDRAVAAARAAFESGKWSGLPAAERADLLHRTADLLVRDREHVALLETRDTGKTLRESRADVDDVVAVLRYYAGLAVVDVSRVVDAGPGVDSRVVAEPAGVCALVTPWNYPLLEISWKLAPALAAGCTAVVKPSELTPLTTAHLLSLLAEAGLPSGVVNLVLGDGEVGAALVAHPGVDLVSFTGGTATGRAVLRAAADTVKRVHCELGGKNPNVVFPDVDVDVAVDNALYAAFLHAGQVCSAGSRLIVHADVHDAVVAGLSAGAEAIRLGDGRDERTQSGPLISAAQRARTEGMVARALADGAVLAAGGRRPEDPALRDGFFYRPTVLTGCRRDTAVVREEVFGPVLTVETFTDEQEAVALANDTVYGLAGAVWTGDDERAERVAAALRCGTVWINDYHPYVPGAEWGGRGQSGVGRELGPTGLAEYRELKHVWRRRSPGRSGWLD